jgi:photosystem II stability/assembly factor-like uncharacterized protein/5-hydroxyisourate hydrolase-like protein (transthyretin family)
MSKRVLISLISGMLLTSLPWFATAETITQNRSEATNLGLYGGEVRDVATDPDGQHVYVTTYSPNGFFRSDDAGATWHGLDAEVYDLGEPRGVELDEDGNVYLLISDGLFKSTDHGVTLESIGNIDANGNNLIYHDGTLLVGRNDGAVSISTNQGSTFTTTDVIQTDSYVLSLAGSPTTDQYYAVLDDNNNGTLYVSNDGGNTWAEGSFDDISNRYTTIAVDPDDANHLLMLSYGEDEAPWQSYDAGTTWDQTDITGTTPTVITFDSTGRIYAGTAYSDNNGSTWSNLNTTTPSNRVSNVWPDATDDNRLYGSTFGAVAITSDRGVTWSDSNQGITAVTVYDVAQSADKETVWIATNAGLAHTTNFTAESPTWEFPINYDYYPNAVWVSPADSNIVVVGGYQALYRTTDGGNNWTTISNWDSDYAVQKVVSDPTDSTVVYAIGGTQNLTDAVTGAVMMSSDAGATWTDLAITDSAAGQAAVVTADGTLYVGAGAIDINADSATGVYKYDGSWTHLSDSPAEQITSLATDPDNANVLYATASNFNSNQQSDGGVYQSTDAGATWTKLSTTSSGLENASKYRVITMQNSTRTLYMAGTNIDNNAGTIWKSTDGGSSWGIYYTGLENETFNSLLFDGLVAGNTRGAYDIRGKAKFSTNKSATKISATVKDAATNKKLKHKKITLWKKKHGDWVKVDTDHSNSRGKVQFHIHPRSTSQYRLKYKPTGSAAEEYTTSRSNTIRISL